MARSLPLPAEEASEALVLDDVMGGFRDWKLQNPGVHFVFLRPDRYVAAVSTIAEVNDVSAGLRRLIGSDIVSGAASRQRGALEVHAS